MRNNSRKSSIRNNTKSNIFLKNRDEIKRNKSNYFSNINKCYRLKYSKSNEITILLLGATGDGKSQLGNFILNNPTAFKVSDDIYSETKETRGEYGINGAEDLFVIDTPGLQDTNEKDKEILNQMASYVKSHQILHAIIIVLNFEVDRLSSYIQDMLKRKIKLKNIQS